MLKTDKFAFIEMPRTGSTHTKHLLQDLFAGKRVGMHEPADEQTLASHRAFIGTVRNPWDWYISHWSMYCGGVGMLHHRTGRSREMIRNGPAKGEIHDPEVWTPCISKSDPPDVKAFRLWVKTLCRPEIMRRALPFGFGKSGLHQFAGIYTHRYASLFCTNQHALNQPGAVTNLKSLGDFVDQNCYVNYMVRTENLAKDLEAALGAIGIDLTPEQIKTIHEAPARNRANRTLTQAAYYDEETIALITERDRFIIDLYGYSYPPPLRDEIGRQSLPNSRTLKNRGSLRKSKCRKQRDHKVPSLDFEASSYKTVPCPVPAVDVLKVIRFLRGGVTLKQLLCFVLLACQSLTLYGQAQEGPVPAEKTIVIRWETASEHGSFGYDIYRGPTEDGPFSPVNAEPVESAGTIDIPQRYEFEDDTAQAGTVYWYYVEAISLSGERKRVTPIYASNPTPPDIKDG